MRQPSKETGHGRCALLGKRAERRKRHRHERCAEIAPPHSITLSARASRSAFLKAGDWR
jgi:hypothetical protein